MFDFVALRQANGSNHEQVTLQLRTTLLQIISHLTQPETLAPAFILNTLSIAMAYLIIHTHQGWPTMIGDIAACLSNNMDQVSCML